MRQYGNQERARRRALAAVRMSVDATGHEHKGKGPGGGQFTKGGGGGSGGESVPGANSESGGAGHESKNNTASDRKDVSANTKIENEPIAPPPPGNFFAPNVEKTGPNGVTTAARVGVPAFDLPPPPKIPRLPNLTKGERQAESDFADAYEANPDKMVDDYISMIQAGGNPITFETDLAKTLSHDWMDDDLDKQMKKRQLNNNALHQTANAIAKKAFLKHLDTLAKGDNVLVTVGGCGSGKGYTLKNTERGKQMKGNAKAVWDSAGDQNATENPWILQECEKRGLKATFAYVDGNPRVSWADTQRGVVKRAHDQSDGRMVDAAVFADSYVLGAKNMDAFHKANKTNPNAEFVFFRAGEKDELPGVPEESLRQDRKALYHWAMNSILSRDDVDPFVTRGGTNGARIWNQEFATG